MKVKFLTGLALAALVMTFISCENKSAPLSVGCILKASDTLNISYSSTSNAIKPIIDAQCGTSNNACHSPGGTANFDYTSYSGVMVNVSPKNLIYKDLFQTNPPKMPLIPQPGWNDSSSCMLAKLKAWLNAGAPQ